MRTPTSLRAALSALLLLALPACGPTATGRGETAAVEHRTIDENRALTQILEVLGAESVARGPAWSVSIGHETSLDVDVRLADSDFGIEWLSPQDRLDLGDAVPGPAEGGQLRIVPGTGGDSAAQILVMEHSSYRYVNEREHVQSGEPGAHDAEERLRRDVRDFLHYVRGQGGLR